MERCGHEASAVRPIEHVPVLSRQLSADAPLSRQRTRCGAGEPNCCPRRSCCLRCSAPSWRWGASTSIRRRPSSARVLRQGLRATSPLVRTADSHGRPAAHQWPTQPGQAPGFQPNPVPLNLPNANLILILGVLSILFCWWHFVSIAGIALGFIALVLAKRETKLYHANPARYTIGSLNTVRTGRTCALIGITISIIVFVFVMLLIFGVLVTLPFWGMIH